MAIGRDDNRLVIFDDDNSTDSELTSWEYLEFDTSSESSFESDHPSHSVELLTNNISAATAGNTGNYSLFKNSTKPTQSFNNVVEGVHLDDFIIEERHSHLNFFSNFFFTDDFHRVHPRFDGFQT